MAKAATKLINWENIENLVSDRKETVVLSNAEIGIDFFVNPLSSLEYDLETDSFTESVTGYEIKCAPEQEKLDLVGLTYEAWNLIAEFIMQKASQSVSAAAFA